MNSVCINRCWTNLGDSVAMATVIPIGVMASATMVIAEAAGMDRRRPLPSTNKDQRTAALYVNKNQ